MATDFANKSVMRTSAGGTAPGQSTIEFASSGGVPIASATTVINYIVPTGKTLYITDINSTSNTTVAALAQLKAGPVIIQEAWILNTSPWNMQGIETQMSVGSGSQVSIAFGAAAATTVTYNVSGYIQ